MRCAEVDELLGAYALDALDPAERAEVELHLEECALHPLVSSLSLAAARLADLAPERDPSPELRARVLGIARTSVGAPPPLETLGPSAPREATRSVAWWRRPSAAYALAAAFAMLALVMAAWNVTLRGEPTAVVRTATSGGFTSTLVYVPGDQFAVFEVDGLEEAAPAQSYQLWTIAPGGTPEDAGLVEVRANRVVASLHGPLHEGTTLAITLEPAGGSPQPTSAPLVALQY